MKKLLLILLLVITIFSRLYKISSLPPALYQDETAIGYNAYLILTSQKDEWGEKFPVYFKSFGDYKLPLYIYITAGFIKIFGLNELSVRLPSAIAGIMAVILFILILKELTNNFSMAITGGFLLSFNPQHIFFSRAGFEVNLSLMLILAGVYLFLNFAKTKKATHLFFSTLFFTLATYSYNVARLISPLLLLSLVILYRRKILKIGWKILLLIATFNLLLLLPFIFVFFSPLGLKTAKGEVIFSSPYVFTENVQFRAYLLEHFPSFLIKLFFNKIAFVIHKYLQNLASIISFEFFFVKGTSHPNQRLGNIGYFHLFELPFIIYGLYYGITKNIKKHLLFILWFLIAYFALALSRQVPHATRGFYLIPALLYFESLSWYLFLKWLKNLTRIKKIIVSLSLSFAILYLLFYFTLSYIYIFPREKAKAWGVAQKKLALYLKNKYDQYEKIIIDKKAPLSYTTLAFYLKLDPKDFFNNLEHEKSGDLYFAKKFGKFEIRDVNLNDDLKPNTLLILDGLAQPPSEYIVKKIKLPKRHIALSLQDKIVQWPEEKTEFIVVSLH